MDQQSNDLQNNALRDNVLEDNVPEREPVTAEEIARLEREAALAGTARTPAAKPAEEPEGHPAARERYAAPEIDDDDEDDAPTEWVPSRFEKRIHAIPQKRWDLYQIAGGALIGAFTVFALFYGGAGVSALFLIAIVLALVAPRILEDCGRRKLDKFRLVMLIVLAVGIAALVLYNGLTHGWSFFAEKEASEEALRFISVLRA